MPPLSVPGPFGSRIEGGRRRGHRFAPGDTLRRVHLEYRAGAVSRISGMGLGRRAPAAAPAAGALMASFPGLHNFASFGGPLGGDERLQSFERL